MTINHIFRNFVAITTFGTLCTHSALVLAVELPFSRNCQNHLACKPMSSLPT